MNIPHISEEKDGKACTFLNYLNDKYYRLGILFHIVSNFEASFLLKCRNVLEHVKFVNKVHFFSVDLFAPNSV